MGESHLISVHPEDTQLPEPTFIARALPLCHMPDCFPIWGRIGLSHWLQKPPATMQPLSGRALPSPDPSSALGLDPTDLDPTDLRLLLRLSPSLGALAKGLPALRAQGDAQ